jgi:integrase
MRSLFRVALLTGQRIGNVAAMRWDAIADDLWRIRAEEFKGRRPHLVPLSVEVLGAIEALRGLDPGVVFLGRVDAKRPHVVTTGRALRRIRERTNLPHWTAHDFRTTLRTHATRAKEDGGLGVAPNVADAVLGHAENTLGWSRYQGDRDRYLLHEKRAALECWGRFVQEAVEEEDVQRTGSSSEPE